MGKLRVCEPTLKLQMLLVGGSEEDFAFLHHRWTRDNNDRPHLDHALSTDDALAQLHNKAWDVLLCSHKLADDDALHLLREVRQHDSRISVVFLSNHASHSTIETALRAAHCDRPVEKIRQQARWAVDISSPSQVSTTKLQRQKATETLQSESAQQQKMDAIVKQAGGVAHDFNNLLVVISGYAELMLDSLAEDHPLRRNVAKIMNASRRATGLTRQLLAFGRKADVIDASPWHEAL